MPKKQVRSQHVIPINGRWVVRGEGNIRATSVHTTQREAIEAARQIARNNSSDLIVHRSDGRIRERDSYSSDPRPPRIRKILDPISPGVIGAKKISEAVKEVIEESKAIN
jgi:hypothetical protein